MGLRNDPEALRRYNRERAAVRRRQWLAGKCCVKCGATDRLEVDHIDRAQKVDHNVWSWAPARREAELAKCQVLCRDCHWEKTRAELYPPVRQHGTSSMWRIEKCRCELCRAYAREAQRRYRAAHPGRRRVAA